jgi:hypothetical protein
MKFFNYRLKDCPDSTEDVQQNSTQPPAPQGMHPLNPVISHSPSHGDDAHLSHWPRREDDSVFSINDTSYTSSLNFTQSDLRSTTIKDIKCEVMVNWLHSKQEEKLWTVGEPGEGVVLKKSKGTYVCCPVDLQHEGSQFYEMVAALNVRVRLLLFLSHPTPVPLLFLFCSFDLLLLCPVADSC